MDHPIWTQERIARRALEENQQVRCVTYLNKLEKEVLLDVSKRTSKDSDGVGQDSIEAAALRSLQSLGLVSLRCNKAGIVGELTYKGQMLLHENPKLRFPVPENTRWIIATVISVLALLVAAAAMIRTYL